MLLSLAEWLQTQMPQWGFLRVFQYITFRAVMAALTALLIGLIAGPTVIRHLTATKNWSASPRLRDAKSLGEVGDAHHGRCIGFDWYL